MASDKVHSVGRSWRAGKSRNLCSMLSAEQAWILSMGWQRAEFNPGLGVTRLNSTT